MLGLHHAARLLCALGCALSVAAVQAQDTGTAIERGLSWLTAQVDAMGAITTEGASIELAALF